MNRVVLFELFAKSRSEDGILYSRRFTYFSERSNRLADEITSFFVAMTNRSLIGLCESIHSPICTLGYDKSTGNLVFDSIFSGFLCSMSVFTALANEFANTVAEDLKNLPLDQEEENLAPIR